MSAVFSPKEFRDTLVLDPGIRYMNMGTSGPMPRRSLEAQCEIMYWMSRRGPGSYEVLKRYFESEQATRDALARCFGGDADRYVLTQSTSEGVNIVLNGFPWQPGDEIVTTDLEHSGLVLPVYRRAETDGLRLRILRLLEGDDPLAAFEAALTPQTRMLAISHVAFCDGRVLPMERLIERAHQAGVAVLLDAAQSAGQITARWDSLGADFVTFPGQKWLMGPEGIGALYLHGDWVQRLQPDRVGWAGDDGFDHEGHYTLKTTAARFELGTKDPAAGMGLRTSLELLSEFGLSVLAGRIKEIAQAIRTGLSGIRGVQILGPANPETHSALIAFRVGDQSPTRIVQLLEQEAGIIARWVPPPHPPAVRISCGAFSTDQDVEVLLDTVMRLSKAK